jgi:hypothetical protein
LAQGCHGCFMASLALIRGFSYWFSSNRVLMDPIFLVSYISELIFYCLSWPQSSILNFCHWILSPLASSGWFTWCWLPNLIQFKLFFQCTPQMYSTQKNILARE